MEKKSSIGVRIIGIINLSILGVFPVLMGLVGLFCYFGKNDLYREMVTKIPNPKFILFFSIAVLIFGMLYGVTGYGLLMLKNIARKTTIYSILFFTLLGIIRNIGNIKLIIMNPITIYLIIVLFYLTRPKVKEQFK